MRFSPNPTLRSTLAVCFALIFGFVFTGIASSSYRRHQVKLGEMHFEEGKTLEAHGQLENSLEEYRKALLFSSDKSEYRISLATALLDAGKLDEAQSHLEQLLQEDPTNGRLNLLLARVAVRNGKIRQAIDYYQRAVYEYWPQSDLPKRRQARWELAGLLRKTGDQTGYVAELMQLYNNLGKADLEQRLKVGKMLLRSGADSEAIAIFDTLAKEAPQNAAVVEGIGEINLKTGNFVAARHEFQRAARLDPLSRESAEKLALTNDAIDLDSTVPGLSVDERLRRSRNLLSRITDRLSTCSDARNSALGQRLSNANALLDNPGQKGENRIFELRDAAQQLWRDKTSFCPSAPPSDSAVDLVIARLMNGA